MCHVQVTLCKPWMLTEQRKHCFESPPNLPISHWFFIHCFGLLDQNPISLHLLNLLGLTPYKHHFISMPLPHPFQNRPIRFRWTVFGYQTQFFNIYIYSFIQTYCIVYLVSCWFHIYVVNADIETEMNQIKSLNAFMGSISPGRNAIVKTPRVQKGLHIPILYTSFGERMDI